MAAPRKLTDAQERLRKFRRADVPLLEAIAGWGREHTTEHFGIFVGGDALGDALLFAEDVAGMRLGADYVVAYTENKRGGRFTARVLSIIRKEVHAKIYLMDDDWVFFGSQNNGTSPLCELMVATKNKGLWDFLAQTVTDLAERLEDAAPPMTTPSGDPDILF